ncbi:MAG: SPASM domain-containing protein [Clostridia bacterium]|nr:SPASM domain-containing protein [Clostridia bacterium]
MEKAYLEINNICNLSCDFCHKTRREKRLLTEAEFEVLTDRLQGEVKYLFFHLMGEPFLHPLLPQFVKRAREKGFLPAITTNGTLLAARGEELLAAPPYKISISLHAPAANAAFAKENYLPACIEFGRRMAELGTIVAFRLWNIGGAGECENEKVLAALRRAFPAPWEDKWSGYRLAHKVFLEWGEEFAWPDLAAPAAPADMPLFCYALRQQVGILVDGTVVPCCLDAEGTLALGNLHEAPLAKILQSPRARAIYDGFTEHRATEELCRRCGYARRFKK